MPFNWRMAKLKSGDYMCTGCRKKFVVPPMFHRCEYEDLKQVAKDNQTIYEAAQKAAKEVRQWKARK